MEIPEHYEPLVLFMQIVAPLGWRVRRCKPDYLYGGGLSFSHPVRGVDDTPFARFICAEEYRKRARAHSNARGPIDQYISRGLEGGRLKRCYRRYNFMKCEYWNFPLDTWKIKVETLLWRMGVGDE